MKRMRVAFGVFLLATAGCQAPEEEVEPTPTPTATAPPTPAGLAKVTITLARGAGSDVDVVVHVVDSAGNPVVATPPSIAVLGGTASAIVDAGAGDYMTTVSADVIDSDVKITATSAQASASKTALVFSNLDASVGQPEAIDGLVNTPAWEDGANVSPDGKWLIVGSYLPLDPVTCLQSGGLPSNPACATLIGPYAAPERPGMLGASRMHGTTYDNVCPSFGITTPPADFSLMPAAAFGFKRLADGSFGEPFVIGYEADGCGGGYGHSFTASPSGTSAGIVFANHDFFKATGFSDSDLYYAPLTLGVPNILGTFQHSGGVTTKSGELATPLAPILDARQGNPSYGGGRIWWDDEDLADGDRELYYADLSGTLPAVTAGPVTTVGVSVAGQEDIQPMLDGNVLVWMGSGQIYRSTLTASANPALAGSWSARQTLLGPATVTNIVATGEPTIAHIDGKTELYFVYVKRTATGLDANVARVPLN